jgi:molybdopterin converting factor small subunit
MEKGERVIRVEVRLYATLKKYHPSKGGARSGHRPEGKNSEPGEALVCELAEGTTVQKFLEKELGIPPGEVKIVFINGVSRSFDHVLADGDRVGIFPPIAGG